MDFLENMMIKTLKAFHEWDRSMIAGQSGNVNDNNDYQYRHEPTHPSTHPAETPLSILF